MSATAAELVAGYTSGALSPVDVARASLAAAVAVGERFAAIASIDAPGAIAAAEESAARWASGAPLGPLDGVPITFKDSFHVRGLPRWHGTAAHDGARSSADAAPVRRAREAGMLVVAKTTMPDFAMLMSGLSSQHGVIRNAWNPEHNPGGSSAGAGASVVAGVAPIAVGTDMVGSVRLPAALSGLPSLKPTQGRIAYDPAGDYRSAGPMARSVDDVEAALEVLGQGDLVDHYALPGRYARPARRDPSLAGRRVALLRRLSFGAEVDDETEAAVEVAAALLRDRGAEIVEIDDLDAAADDYEAVYWFMLYRGLPDYLGTGPAARTRVLPAIARMFDVAATRTAVQAAEGEHRIAVATERVRRQLAPFDYVLSPALPTRSFAATAVSPVAGEPLSHMGFACWFNRLGSPAGTVPVRAGAAHTVPVSVQLAGRRFDDGGVLQVLRLLEEDRGFDIPFPSMPWSSIAPTAG